MTVVTAFTAAKTQAILNQTIKTASVNGSGNLILTKYDGTTVDAGYVLGSPGPAGPAGEVSTASLNAAIATEVTNRNNGILSYGSKIGTGIIAHAIGSGTSTTWTSSGSSFYIPSGTSLTVDFDETKHYKIEAAAYIMYASGSPCSYILEIQRETSPGVYGGIARGSLYSPIANTTGAALASIIINPTTWTSSTEKFRLGIRASEDNTHTLKNDFSNIYISIIDLGKINKTYP